VGRLVGREGRLEMPKASKGYWTTLDVQTAKRRDGVEHVELLRSARTQDVIRIRMRADAFAEQSYALVELWASRKWEELHFLVELPTDWTKLYVVQPVSPAPFDAPRAELLQMATFILGG
jgi:hypothetical protein